MAPLIQRCKAWLQKLLPTKILTWYHRVLVKFGAWRYHYPSNQLVVIGVTGTKGKSTTCNAVWHMLTAAGYTVGMATTANFRIGDKEWLNDTKMTMLGRMQLQKLLSDMVQTNCQFAIVETSSEGIKQSRHLGISYDAVVFTNLSPEHIDAHGSFENYKQAKLDLFRYASNLPVKLWHDQPVHKVSVINGDDEAAADFIAAAQLETSYIWSQHGEQQLLANLRVSNVTENATGLGFVLEGYQFTSPLRGAWNVENIVPAIALGLWQGMSLPQCVEAVKTFGTVPGRMELIEAGQPFTVVVDYAYEPKSLGLLYNYWRRNIGAQNKIITLISSTGGGRDISRRAGNGKVAGELCDFVIVADEDPYDDDPMIIAQAVLGGVQAAGKIYKQNCWLILDRKRAIEAACTLAKPGDVVILPCKGTDQKICRAHGKKEPWDDRTVAKEVLAGMLTK